MNRKALIIYMTDSPSGTLVGPASDNANFHRFLTSRLGGDWYDNEIISLNNPSCQNVKNVIATFADTDYSFIVFSGHGEFEEEEHLQYIELKDTEMSIMSLITDAPRQTIIIDACRGYFSKAQRLLEKSMRNFSSTESFAPNISTRKLFENYIDKAEKGVTVMYATNENQSALDTDKGAAYITSLINAAKAWGQDVNDQNMLSVKAAHELSIKYMRAHFVTTQTPVMNGEKRLRYYPFAVKHIIGDL